MLSLLSIPELLSDQFSNLVINLMKYKDVARAVNAGFHKLPDGSQSQSEVLERMAYKVMDDADAARVQAIFEEHGLWGEK